MTIGSQRPVESAQAADALTARTPARSRIIGLTGAVWVAAAALSSTRDPGLIAVAGSFAIGWSHLVGRCGTSHLGALTPLGKIPGRRGRWLVNVLVYVAAGALASGGVGAALGAAGGLLVPSGLRDAALVVVLGVALVAAASELGVINWRLPEPDRQTRREWSQRFRPPVPAALWGLGLGLTVATVFTFSGTWLVLTLPVALGEPTAGALLLVAHWFGRAVPVLVGPALLDHAAHTPDLMDDVAKARVVFRATNVVGIGLMSLSSILLIAGA